MKSLDGFLKAGGTVISCGPALAMVNGRCSADGEKLALHGGWRQVKPEKLAIELAPSLDRDRTAIHREHGDKGILFHQRRQLDDGELVLLVNTSIEAPSKGFVESRQKGAEVWDCRSGGISLYPCQVEVRSIKLSFELPPCGSLLLFLASKANEQSSTAGAQTAGGPTVKASVKPTTVAAVGELKVRRLEPNVLTLDYLDVAAGGETLKNAYFYRANQFAFQKNGMPRNPWDSAVQFKEELISKKFPPGSGFTATYRFTVAGEVPQPLWIVIERPDLYRIACNGKPVAARPGQWWLDQQFGKINITAEAKTGENAVTLEASPMNIYDELEPAYLLGDFALKPAEKGFAIAPPVPLTVAPSSAGGGWNQQGCPFYSAGVSYSQTFEIQAPSGRYAVSVPSWYGSVAKVIVNGKLAGHLTSQPWEVDVTGEIQAGTNTVEVVVIGTLKNTLGPHHAGKLRGRAWPDTFHQGPKSPPPGDAYDTIGYGLFAPFTLSRCE